MSENEIKPVAWTIDEQLEKVNSGLIGFIALRDLITPAADVLLYDQQAIDRLTAERDALRIEKDRLQQIRQQLESERDAALESRDRYWDERNEAQRKLSVAVAEGKGLVAAAARARRCLAWACEQRPEFNEEYEALDAAIDAARTEGQR